MKTGSSSPTRLAHITAASLVLLGFVIACGDTGTSTSAGPTPVTPSSSGATALAESSLPFTAPPPRGDREPPAALVEACADINVGSACTFVGREGETVAGTCTEGRGDSGVVLCRPNDRPDRPSREERRAKAAAACAGLTEGVSCAIDGPNRSISGTCRIPPEGESLFCVPEERRRER